MIKINETGKAVQETINSVDCEDVVNRMHALIGLLQNQSEDTLFNYDSYLVLEMLREQLPTHEQAEQYLKTRSKEKWKQ